MRPLVPRRNPDGPARPAQRDPGPRTASAGFFGAEVYLPYLLVERYDFSPTFAGLTLDRRRPPVGGARSGVQSRLGGGWAPGRRADRLADGAAGDRLALGTTALGWPAAVAIAGWVLAGGGMGLMYPRLSVMTLALSTPDTEGFNSSAMSISDSLGGALSLAATGIVFTAFTTTAASFAGVFVLTAVIAAAAVTMAPARHPLRLCPAGGVLVHVSRPKPPRSRDT